MTVPVKQPMQGDIIESVLIKGDLSKLSPEERSTYYLKVCESAGLNPLTQPFAYIVLNGKLTLYALRACTDQLRTIHKVAVEELVESERDGVFIVTAKVRNGEGRTDMAKGAVTINGLKGDALANAMMKAETKAKRRATLSICGLGFLDETEIETIPAAAKKPVAAPNVMIEQPAEHDPETGEVRNGNGSNDETILAMAREAAERGERVFKSFYAKRTDQQRAVIDTIGTELRSVLDAAQAAE